MQNFKSKKKQGGFTLMEIAIGAIIFALLASIIAPLLNEAKDKTVMVTQELSLMRTTIQNIGDRYSDEFVTTDLDNQELIEGNILPSAYRRNNTSFEIFNMWGGQVVVAGVDNNGLTWTTEKVPTPVCTKFVDDAKSLGFETVSVDGQDGVYSEMQNADITQLCQSTNDNVTIVFTREES